MEVIDGFDNWNVISGEGKVEFEEADFISRQSRMSHTLLVFAYYEKFYRNIIK